MGFSPHQKQRVSTADYLMLAGASIAAAALVVWAFVS
jgi:hypothetical protein